MDGLSVRLVHFEKAGRPFRKTGTLFSLKRLVCKHNSLQISEMPWRCGDAVRGGASQQQHTHLEHPSDRAWGAPMNPGSGLGP